MDASRTEGLLKEELGASRWHPKGAATAGSHLEQETQALEKGLAEDASHSQGHLKEGLRHPNGAAGAGSHSERKTRAQEKGRTVARASPTGSPRQSNAQAGGTSGHGRCRLLLRAGDASAREGARGGASQTEGQLKEKQGASWRHSKDAAGASSHSEQETRGREKGRAVVRATPRGRSKRCRREPEAPKGRGQCRLPLQAGDAGAREAARYGASTRRGSSRRSSGRA